MNYISIKQNNETLYLGIKRFKDFNESNNPYDLIWADFITLEKMNDGDYILLTSSRKDLEQFSQKLQKQSELIKLKVIRNPEVYIFNNEYRFSNFIEFDDFLISNIGVNNE